MDIRLFKIEQIKTVSYGKPKVASKKLPRFFSDNENHENILSTPG